MMQNVILIGGFADSVSLRKHLKTVLHDFCEKHNQNTGFLLPRTPYVQFGHNFELF